jgi:outer membrane receptor protein involved in Fe transport
MFRQLSVAAIAAVVLVAMPVASNAQDTTSAIRGKILDPNGAPVAGASIVVEDTRSGVARSLTTSDTGLFLATRLLPGGPYRVTVNGTDSAVVPSIEVGDTYNFSMNLVAGETIDEIVTVGKATDIVDVASGPAATFSIADLENTVAFSRDIADVYGIDPRLMIDIDEDGVSINCGGKHPRFNSTTLDGVSVGDRFGLNDNGYATAVGMPFPYDGIEQVAVELAPFDVTYGGFSACIINSVTRAGTNEWEGKAFYEYSNNDMRGDTIKNDDNDYGRGSYDKWNMGFNIGGPIIKDTLFFHASYEKSEVPRFLAKGYEGSGNGEQRSWLSQDDYERIEAIAMSDTYNYDPGGLPGDGLQENEKYLLRVDWNISDNHNAAVIYGFFDGYQLRDSDGDDNEFEFANHYYTKGAEFESMTFKLASQWTDNFSTELFYNNSTMDDSQVTVGDKEFGDIQITVEEADGTRNTVYLGADDSRQANSLDTETEYLKLSANYLAGNHVITGGYERETVDVFNIFVQHSRGGEYDFFDSSADNDPACAALTPQERYDRVDGCGPSGIDRFELGRPSRMYYGSAGVSNNPLDAAAVFSNTQNTVYLQDEIFVDHLDLTLVAGLRYEWWDSDDNPTFNRAFTDATNGLRNDSNLDGIDILLPRFGFTWEVRDDLALRGGVGKYTGGNPLVWISNAWSNDGVTNVQPGGRSGWDAGEFFDETGTFSWTILDGSDDSVNLVGQGRPYRDVPQLIYDFVEDTTVDDANTQSLALIDPDFKQPAEWKFALGGTWDMPWYDLSLDFDYLHTRGDNMAYYKDVSQEIVGYTTAGSPIYDYYGDGEDNLMLTNSGETPTSNMVSFVLTKEWEWGLEAKLGYAWVDGEDVSPMVASTAGSNFTGGALLDINNPRAAQSNWTVPQRLTLSLYYSKALFGDNLTRIMLQGYANEGQAQSYVMESDGLEGDGFNDRHLLYVPTGPDDPNVVYDEDWDDDDAFWAFVDREGLSPGFTTRNDINARWSTVWNLSIRQDISLGDRLRAIAYLKIRNLGNLLNDDWGRVTDSQYFPIRAISADVNDEGQSLGSTYRRRHPVWWRLLSPKLQG